MTKQLIAIFILSSIHLSSFSQNCDCQKDLDFIISKIENEHPGFKLNVNKNNLEQYNKWKTDIKKEIDEDDTRCVPLLNKYLSFIKDKHLKVYSPKVVDDKAYEKKLFTEKLPSLEVKDDFQYIKVPSFNYRLWQELDQFYDSITPLVKGSEYLIIDIRDNGGGGERMYKQLLQIVKKEAPGKVAVLFNKRCASACEEVALKMSNMKNVITMGENTNGQFAYGFIKGLKTPHCGLSFIITTKKYPKRIKYEYVGVAPEIELNSESDWVDEAFRHLKNVE